MSSSSDESVDDSHLPAAYRPRKRRDSSSSGSSSKTYSDCSEDEKRKRRPVRKREKSRGRDRRRAVKKDRPMWKEEGELSDDWDSDTDSRRRRRSRSRTRSDRRRRERARCSERRRETREKPFQCQECGCRFFTAKGRIHHEMNEHSLEAQCHICLLKFDTKKLFREHYELEHTHERVQCVFCKSVFENPLEMKEERWEEVFSHIYGELLYSRLAQHDEQKTQ